MCIYMCVCFVYVCERKRERERERERIGYVDGRNNGKRDDGNTWSNSFGLAVSERVQDTLHVTLVRSAN